VPWCDCCDRYLAPNTVRVDGTCPACEERVDTSDLKNPPPTQVPWHFWFMLAALVVYLGWRLVESIIWVAGKF
jgi:hypothetical protein